MGSKRGRPQLFRGGDDADASACCRSFSRRGYYDASGFSAAAELPGGREGRGGGAEEQQQQRWAVLRSGHGRNFNEGKLNS